MGAACCSDIDKAGALAASAGGPQQVHSAPTTTGGGPSGQPPAAVAATSGGNDQFVSQVGELPKFNKPSRGRGVDQDASSETSSRNGADLDGVSDMVSEVTSKQQRQQAKAVVKDFVKDMVKGRKLNVMTQAGQVRTCSASLNRSLDSLSIKVGPQKRTIKLKDVEEIHAGDERIEGVTTPLDELCATLMLASEDCITFRLNDVNDRDTFVMCLLMFCNHQK